MTEAPPLVEYYPQYCFHLSPTLNRWCPVRAAFLQSLTQRDEFWGQHVFFHLNHPFKWVRITGVVVAYNEYYGRIVYTVDDGSGATIECVVLKVDNSKKDGKKTVAKPSMMASTSKEARNDTQATTAAADPAIHIGQVVGVKGELQVFRKFTQIHTTRMAPVYSTEAEVQFWAKVQSFAADVLSRPWVLEEDVVRQCREEAEEYVDPGKNVAAGS